MEEMDQCIPMLKAGLDRVNDSLHLSMPKNTYHDAVPNHDGQIPWILQRLNLCFDEHADSFHYTVNGKPKKKVEEPNQEEYAPKLGTQLIAHSKDLDVDKQDAGQLEMLLQMDERRFDKEDGQSDGQSDKPKSDVPPEVLEALHKLADEVEEKNYRREDLATHEVTEQLYPYIPNDADGNQTSLGSILHDVDSCKPCLFFRRDSCHKKDLCLYCHFPHDIGPVPRCRKSKKKRMRQHKANQALMESMESDETHVSL
jgi:hypothetical protein